MITFLLLVAGHTDFLTGILYFLTEAPFQCHNVPKFGL